MNDTRTGAEVALFGDFGALTLDELAATVGGDGYFAHAVGYAIGFVAYWVCAIIVTAATRVDLQPYMYGA